MEGYPLQEPPEKYVARERVLEKLLHCIWSEQLFRRALQFNGQTLVISSPGWWNLEAGPDFRNSEIFIAGNRLCGDVEIHLHSEDWYHHGHHNDPRYNAVIMHVVLQSSHKPCIKQNGDPVPELEIKDYLMEELRLLREKIPIHQFPFGPETNVRLCRRFMEEHNEEEIARILDSAGDLRMLRKKETFLERIKTGGFLQAFYEGVMEGMGYKQSRYAFRELARRVQIEELLRFDLNSRRGIDSMAAVLLGTGGLMEELSQFALEPRDPETAHYMEDLGKRWKTVSGRFMERKLVGFSWYPSSTRPANFPARRLTAVAALFHYHRSEVLSLLLRPLQQHGARPSGFRKIRKDWLELFARPLHIYWSYHFQFERRKFSAPQRLIGPERGKILTVNVVLPSLLAHAHLSGDKDLEQKLHALYRAHPLIADNSVTRLMEHRLFASREKSRYFIHTAHRQQALHHFFYDFCDNRESSCSRCEFNER